MRRLAPLVGVMLLVTGMAASVIDFLEAPKSPPRPFDVDVAVQYSREYGLVFDPVFGGPQHAEVALRLNEELRATLRPEAPQAADLDILLALHRQILLDAERLPGGPGDAISLLMEPGGGTRLETAILHGKQAAAQGRLASAGLDSRPMPSLGSAPGPQGVQAHWEKRLEEWMVVRAQLHEARGAYLSFFAAAEVTEPSIPKPENQSSASALYAVPTRVLGLGTPSPADLAAHEISKARAAGQKANLIVALATDDGLTYCWAIEDKRTCPENWARDLDAVSMPQELGVISGSHGNWDESEDGGFLGIFNSGQRATGPLQIHLASVDGTWNATATLGPVPSDGGRFIAFESLGAGAVRVSATEAGRIVMQWHGESIPGVGVVME